MTKEVKIEIFQKQKKIKIDEDYIKNKLKKIEKYISILPKYISIYLVNNKKIKEINRKFLGKSYSTDILTFKYSKNYGEMIISVEECKKNAELYGNTLEQEILYVIIHGFLHLVGYKDYSEMEKKKMFLKQDEIFEIIVSKNEKEKKL